MKQKSTTLPRYLVLLFILLFALVIVVVGGSFFLSRNETFSFEAENGELGDLWLVQPDTTAVDGHYLTITPGFNKTNQATNNPSGQAKYTFTVTQTGGYKIWGCVRIESGAHNSFWVRVDDQPWLNWNNIPVGLGWHWDDVHGVDNRQAAKTYQLAQGEHTLTIAYREEGAKLDKLLLTNNLSTRKPTTPDCSSGLWFEAESGELGASLTTDFDETASQGQFITLAAQTAVHTNDPAREAIYSFTLTEEGDYKLWGCLATIDQANNAFWVKIDQDAWIGWRPLFQGEGWYWDDLHNHDKGDKVEIYHLGIGAHTLTLAPQAVGAKLDKLLLTKDITTTPTNALCVAEYWLEAEKGASQATWALPADTTASNEQYIYKPLGSSLEETTAVPPTNSADYAVYFFSVTQEGVYTIWGCVSIDSTQHDSFWVKVDNAPWVNWNNISSGAGWHWDNVHNSDQNENMAGYHLGVGPHTLTIAAREEETKLDLLLITSDLTQTPTSSLCTGEVPLANS